MKKILALIITLFILSGAAGQTKKIVFVCEHGAAKSVIATTYFNRLAAERGLPWEAVCRATAPDSTLSAGTRAGLKNDNIPQNQNPQKLSWYDTTNVERIILFTPLPANYETAIPTEDWSQLQNVDAHYQQRKAAIIKQLNTLLDSLEK
jgi:arsenate reductase (thioredoxin)